MTGDSVDEGKASEIPNLELQYNEVKISKVLRDISHDIRGPLGNIKSFSEILLDGQEDFKDDESREMLSHIQKIASDLILDLENLLDVSKINKACQSKD